MFPDRSELTSSTWYVFQWWPAGGTFNVSFDHDAAGRNVQSSSSGRIRLRTDVDLILNVRATYDYDVRGGDWRCTLGFSAGVPDEELLFFHQASIFDTFLGRPTQGTLSLEGSGILIPAGDREVLIGYSAWIDSSPDGSPQGTGNGTLHFDLTVVPEPAGLTVLAMAAVLTALRRRRTRRKAGIS